MVYFTLAGMLVSVGGCLSIRFLASLLGKIIDIDLLPKFWTFFSGQQLAYSKS